MSLDHQRDLDPFSTPLNPLARAAHAFRNAARARRRRDAHRAHRAQVARATLDIIADATTRMRAELAAADAAFPTYPAARTAARMDVLHRHDVEHRRLEQAVEAHLGRPLHRSH